MQPIANGIGPGSDYYVYTPSAQAQRLFFYPLIMGYYKYLPGYSLRRASLDSYQIMYIKRGKCQVECGGRTFCARQNQIVFVDCYTPHAYYMSEGCEAEWLHFDGANARDFYEAIVTNGDPVITLSSNYRFEKYFHRIYQQIKDPMGEKLSPTVKEALFNNFIVNVLTELLVGQDVVSTGNLASSTIEDSITYINAHLGDRLTLEDLAAKASLSPFYFSRLFKKETGFSPYRYIITARINNAKFLLHSSDASVKSICFSVGFTSESSFCTAFKKETGVTPSAYRMQVHD